MRVAPWTDKEVDSLIKKIFSESANPLTVVSRRVAADAVADLAAHESRGLAASLLARAIDHTQRALAREREDHPEEVAPLDATGELHAARLKVEQLNKSFAGGSISLEAAVNQTGDINERLWDLGPPWRWRDGLQPPNARPFPLEEAVRIPLLDGLDYSATINYYRKRDLTTRSQQLAVIKAQADEERARLARRQAAGLKPYASWEEDLDVLLSMKSQRDLFLSQKLLETPFDLGDGTTKTWGEATPEDHLTRAKWQTKNASGSMRDAARHLKAVEMITRAKKSTLTEVGQGGLA